MPRKTKEINEEKPVTKESKLNKKIDTLIKAVLDSEEPVVKKGAKRSTSKATSATESKASTPKTDKAKVVTKTKKATHKKATKSKTENEEKKTTKKATKVTTEKSAKKATKTASKTASKSTKTTKPAKATKTKTTTKAKVSTKKSVKSVAPTVVEYYDLPYKYNQTVVKVLYQNPTTLFVYWEISDSDIENYKKQYGENFFETTRPVLVVYNDTMNYSFEVNINDFANSWYFSINDSKCDYRVELIRRPNFYNEKIKTDYIYISSSNKIESPNDRILFSTNEPYTVYFKNTKNNHQRKVNLLKLLEELNLTNKDFGLPIIRNVYDLYENIYHINEAGEFSVSLTNPSSGNPSSHSLSSRFI